MTGILPEGNQTAESDDTVEEVEGSLAFNAEDDKLMHSVLEGDKEHTDDAKLIEESINQGLGSFTPDMMMQDLVNNFSLAKELYGETIVRLLSSYNPDYVEKNINIPEFQRALGDRIKEKVDDLKQKGLLDADGAVAEKGKRLAAALLYVEELNHLQAKGFIGEKVHKEKSHYGDKDFVVPYRRGSRYGDLSIRKTVRRAIARGHEDLRAEDLRVFERKSKGSIYVVYGLDASGSIQGKKLEAAKRAGVALAFKAIEKKDHCGLLVYADEERERVMPTRDFNSLVHAISDVRANKQTDLREMIRASISMFPEKQVSKHLLLLTDGMPTIGDDPIKETLQAVSEARSQGISISVVGIGLEDKGVELASRVVEVGEGKFYHVRNLEELDAIILEDYLTQ